MSLQVIIYKKASSMFSESHAHKIYTNYFEKWIISTLLGPKQLDTVSANFCCITLCYRALLQLSERGGSTVLWEMWGYDVSAMLLCGTSVSCTQHSQTDLSQG